MPEYGWPDGSSGGGGGGTPDIGCRVRNSADQGYVLTATPTPLIFNTEDYDTDNMFDMAAPNQVIIRTTGKYFLNVIGRVAIDSEALILAQIMSHPGPIVIAQQLILSMPAPPKFGFSIEIGVELRLIKHNAVSVQLRTVAAGPGVGIVVFGNTYSPIFTARRVA